MYNEEDIESFKKEIIRLKEENRALREEIGRKERKPAFPRQILLLYKNLHGEFIQTINDFPRGFFDEKTEASVSRTIRAALFPETKRPGKRDGAFISCLDMTDEQYTIYLETLSGLLAALDNGRYKEKVRIGKISSGDSHADTL